MPDQVSRVIDRLLPRVPAVFDTGMPNSGGWTFYVRYSETVIQHHYWRWAWDGQEKDQDGRRVFRLHRPA